jgi:hypothetical protein
MKYMNNYNLFAMKRALLILLSALLPVSGLTAQNPNRERLEAYRIGFFTKKLNLTPAEAEKFWPAYNEYQKKRNNLQMERRDIIRDFNLNAATLGDPELTSMGDKLNTTFSDEASLSTKFHNQLKEALPPAKVIMFYQAENQYRALLLNRLKENRPAQIPDQQTEPEFQY